MVSLEFRPMTVSFAGCVAPTAALASGPMPPAKGNPDG